MCGAWLYNCECCGGFVISIFDGQFLTAPTQHLDISGRRLRDKLHENRHKLRALLREHKNQKLATLWLQLRRGPYWPVQTDQAIAQIHLDELLERWPGGVPETLDRIICNLGRETSDVGLPCHHGERSPSGAGWLAMFFAKAEYDANYYLKALIERGWIVDCADRESVEVTPAGWARIEELERTRSSPERPAFVAIWFGDDAQEETTAFMSEVFEDYIKPAIEKAGYRAERVDLVPHNDFVMDKVLGMIRVAPFVVADFTGNRNGVYFEAGVARGLGIPVIHTCRAGDFDRAHFDIKQINTIVWSEPEELGEKLYHRIAGTLGPGPYSNS
ncbi:MAG TPA: hypothetical protein VM487_21915 [Phycisphaerae bacterium]|nr:hypothetical protein [Phycisphaerae bacterium]